MEASNAEFQKLLDSTKNRIRGLKQNQGISDEELTEKALKIIETNEKKSVDILNVEKLFIDKSEKKDANALLKKYLDNYSIETVSDKELLKQVIQLEILIGRLHQKLNKFKADDAKIIPVNLIDTLLKVQSQVLVIKDRLGILTAKDSSDVVNSLEVLKKKSKIWRDENQASRTRPCPVCGQMVLWKVRTDIWEMQKHPFFKDRVLGNEHLVKLFKEGKLSQEDVGKILETSPDYINWLIEKWSRNEEIKN